MRGSWKWGVWAAVAASMLAGCRDDRMPVPSTPPIPRAADANRAGIPVEQGATPSGESGEGEGSPGEGSAVKSLPVGEPTNVGRPGARSSERPERSPSREP